MLTITKLGYRGGAVPTLNRMDNSAEAFATVLILDGTRVNDVRVYEDGIVPTVISRYGTGGGNVPAIMKDEEAVAYDEFNDSISKTHHTLRAGTKQSTGVLGATVRRLTPMECERLQGFPDNWTEGQSDSARYKQMGNAVAVPVVEWIINRIKDEL